MAGRIEALALITSIILAIAISMPIAIIHEGAHASAFKVVNPECSIAINFNFPSSITIFSVHPDIVHTTIGVCRLTDIQKVFILWAGPFAEILLMILFLGFSRTRYIGMLVASRTAFVPLLEFYNTFVISLISSIISGILIVLAAAYLVKYMEFEEKVDSYGL